MSLLIFLSFGLVITLFGHVQRTDAIFPWDEAAGRLLQVGGPLLNTPPPNLYPEAHLTFEGIIKYYGYVSEEYEVVTDDGYILTIHRIPCAANNSICVGRPPVLITPGLTGTSSCFVFNGKQNSPAFILADAGFDVWLANVRGTFYGRRHEALLPDEQMQFWNFSFHEIGIYDLPSTVDFVLKTVDKPQLHLFGYSMGTDVCAVLLSELPQYNLKVKTVTLIAPTLRFSTMKPLARSPVIHVADIIIERLGEVFQNMEVLPLTKNTKLFAQNFCGGIGVLICRSFMNSAMGYDPMNFNVLRLPTFMNHIPAGTSVKNFRHFFQLIKSNTFQHYDYGRRDNVKMYGTTTPPPYNISKITAPVVVLIAQRDTVSFIETDVQWLIDSLPNLVEIYNVPSKTFNHLDFIVAAGLRQFVFQELISVISKYT